MNSHKIHFISKFIVKAKGNVCMSKICLKIRCLFYSPFSLSNKTIFRNHTDNETRERRDRGRESESQSNRERVIERIKEKEREWKRTSVRKREKERKRMEEKE